MKHTKILSLLLSCVILFCYSCGKDEPEPENVNSDNPNVDEYGIVVSQEVDLGLSVNWAGWNIGATKPEECGGYYAWGEVDEKAIYLWDNYKYCDDEGVTKYCTNERDGTVDYKSVLEPMDDVAHVKWGNGWRMPTEKEYEELVENCMWSWIEYKGIYGYKITGKSGNSIFLPAAGYRGGSYTTPIKEIGETVAYWSNTHYESSNRNACYLLAHPWLSEGVVAVNMRRDQGLTVRAVRDSSNGTNVVKNDYEKYGISTSKEVDLGLSVNWAGWNIGAREPKEYGGFYAWGETQEKTTYDWSTYKYCNGTNSTLTKYCTDAGNGSVDYKSVLEPMDDVAHVKWGNGWRMPTELELTELKDNCTWTWVTCYDVSGYKVTGRNGNSIFLPAAGSHDGKYVNVEGLYWGSTLYWSHSKDGSTLYFYKYDEEASIEDFPRYYGFCVRAVIE